MPAPRTFSLKYPGWFEKRQDVRRKLGRINNGVWKSEEEQLDYLRTVFGAVGEDLYFLEPVSFVNGKNIFIGDSVIIGSNSVVNKDIPSKHGRLRIPRPSASRHRRRHGRRAQRLAQPRPRPVQ